MRALLVLVCAVAFAGCTDPPAPDETPPEETRSAGRPIGDAEVAGEPPNLTRRVLDNAYPVTLSGVQGAASVYFNGNNRVRIGGNLAAWIPAHLNVTATWDATRVVAASLTLRAHGKAPQESATGTSPLTLALTTAEMTDGAIALSMHPTDPGVNVEQDVQIDVHLVYEAIAAAKEESGSTICV